MWITKYTEMERESKQHFIRYGEVERGSYHHKIQGGEGKENPHMERWRGYVDHHAY